MRGHTRALVALAIVPSALAAQRPGAGCDGTVAGRVTDARTALPIGFAQLSGRCGRAVATADGAFRLAAAAGDSIDVRRVGYRARRVGVGEGPLVVALDPVAAPLAAVDVAGTTSGDGHLVVEREVDAMRLAGAATLVDAVAQLPWVAARGARGEVALSMRGARAEQVAVTLDGMPLADPATGRADISDIPLAALGGAAVTPGADPVALGSGATGGVLALRSATRPMLAVTRGSFGRTGVEGGTAATLGAVRLGAGGGWWEARNDFPFRNTSAATGSDSTEHRVNADERRASAFASLQHARAQLLVLGSRAEQGMAGEMNVRLYDAARARRERLLVRALASPRGWVLGSGLRAMSSRYEDPLRPAFAWRAGAVSADVDAARALGPVALRAGVGADRATGSGIVAQLRRRAFASALVERRLAVLDLRAGMRGDALEGSGVQPSLDVALSRPGGFAPFVRATQAFRAPTLYDLHFAAPQRVASRPLRPERVVLDAEAGVRVRRGAGAFSASVFERRTRGAIVWFPASAGWSPRNVDRERARGAEGSVSLATRRVEVAAWIGRYDTQLHAGPFLIPTPYVPYLAGGGTATLRAGPASLAATLRAQDRRPTVIAPPTRETELPGTALVHVHAGWRLVTPRVTALLTAGADNLGDVRWESVRGFPAPGRSWSVGLTITPREP